MQPRKVILASAMLAIMLGTGVPTVLAKDHGHSHEKSAPQGLALKNGHKWTTDETLRQAMSHIRAEMAASQPAKQGERIPLEQYHALAKKVNEQIALIVQNCKLDKDADAMLHLVLNDIIKGSDAMYGQNWGNARLGAKKITRALENYGTYFEHPGW